MTTQKINGNRQVEDWSDKQGTDSDLTAIAALTPANDDIIQRKAGAWVNRTIAQLAGDLPDVATQTHAATSSSLSNGSEIPFWDEFLGLLRKTTWASIKTSFYSGLGAMISAGATKTTPDNGDTLVLSDSTDSSSSKALSLTNLKAFLKTYLDTLYATTAKGVTNGDSHDHNGGDGAQIAHSSLSGITTGLHNPAVSSISPTTADITATVNTIYFANLSGLTADRNFKLPSGTVGDIIELKITAGNATYEFILKGDTGVTIDGGSSATEKTRFFITGEIYSLILTTTTNWEVVYDGRIRCKGIMTRITSAGNTTYSAGVETIADWNNIDLDIGNMADLTNDRFNLRRAGYYAPVGSFCAATGIADGKYALVAIFLNTTKVVAGANRQSTAGGAASSIVGALAQKRSVLCAVNDYLQYKFAIEEANIGLGRTDNVTAQLQQITFFSVEEVF